MAVVLENRLGLELNHGIFQAAKVGRGGSAGLERIFKPVPFTGQVEPGRNYLLLDDTLTQGGTFAGLASYIEDGGGKVTSIVALTGKQYSAKLTLSNETLSELRALHGDLEDAFRESLSYGFDALTQSEARYLAKYRPLAAVRTRIAQERYGRLSSPDAGEAGAGQGVTHSLRSLRPGEDLDRALSDRLKAPDQRITFFAHARDRLARLSLDSLNWRGDVLEGTDSLEKRDAAMASLERERRFRQCARQRELRDEGMAGLQPGVLAVYERDGCEWQGGGDGNGGLISGGCSCRRPRLRPR